MIIKTVFELKKGDEFGSPSKIHCSGGIFNALNDFLSIKLCNA